MRTMQPLTKLEKNIGTHVNVFEAINDKVLLSTAGTLTKVSSTGVEIDNLLDVNSGIKFVPYFSRTMGSNGVRTAILEISDCRCEVLYPRYR